MQTEQAIGSSSESRLLSLLEQTSVLSDYRARIGDDFLAADTLFHDAKPGEPPIVIPLHQALYERFYCRLDPVDSIHTPVELKSEGPAPSPAMAPAEFLEQLRSANMGREISRNEWQLHSLTPNGQAFVTCGETIHLSEPGDFSLRQGDGSTPPAIESVVFRTERISHETGFYFGMGETPADAFDRTLVSRLYFNLAHGDAVEWFRMVTTVFNRAQMPFTMKCPVNPQAFERSDSCVLYLPRRYLFTALSLILPILDSLRNQLRPTTPMFTRPLIPGVGFGDDPGTGESFGQHRMRLIARALSQAQSSSDTTPVQKRQRVAQEFTAHGFSLDRPWLSPGATDILNAFCFEVNSQ